MPLNLIGLQGTRILTDPADIVTALLDDPDLRATARKLVLDDATSAQLTDLARERHDEECRTCRASEQCPAGRHLDAAAAAHAPGAALPGIPGI